LIMSGATRVVAIAIDTIQQALYNLCFGRGGVAIALVR
jgi:hypothetical protein